MSRYDRVNEVSGTLGQFMADRVIEDLARNDFGNGGLNKESIKFLTENCDKIEAMFRTGDSLWILPATHEFARELFIHMRGEKDDYEEDYYHAVADEMGWDKVDGRYWLSLWWD